MEVLLPGRNFRSSLAELLAYRKSYIYGLFFRFSAFGITVFVVLLSTLWGTGDMR